MSRLTLGIVIALVFTVVFLLVTSLVYSLFQGSPYAYFLALLVSMSISYSVAEFGPDVAHALKGLRKKGDSPKAEEEGKVRLPCSTCGKPMELIPEYDRWYCYNCRTYGG